MAAEMEKFVALGKETGLEGDELRSFVKEQQDLVREERFRARKAEREAREAEKEQQECQAQLQKEAEECQAQLQERQAQLQKEAREAEREHELQLARIKADQGSANHSGQGDSSQTSTGTAKPKLPRFDEKHNDMDTFIERFERFAESQGWQRDEWAVCLSPLLTGKGLQVFSSMPSDEALQYDVLKKALLKRY